MGADLSWSSPSQLPHGSADSSPWHAIHAAAFTQAAGSVTTDSARLSPLAYIGAESSPCQKFALSPAGAFTVSTPVVEHFSGDSSRGRNPASVSPPSQLSGHFRLDITGSATLPVR